MAERSVTFEIQDNLVTLELPPLGRSPHMPSVFFLGLPKAGSTLLNRVMKPLSESAGLSWYAIQESLRGLGIKPGAYPLKVNELYCPTGYAFGGYRSLPGGLTVPPFAGGRSVFLVRDPRDMLTSLYFSVAVSHSPPGTATGNELKDDFEQKREKAARTTIDDFVLENYRTTIRQFGDVSRKLEGVAYRTWRYEDVIFNKENWVAEMLSYLSFDIPKGIVTQVIAKNDVRPDTEDKSAHIRRVAPGDHREKLLPATIERLNHELAPILKKFNYV